MIRDDKDEMKSIDKFIDCHVTGPLVKQMRAVVKIIAGTVQLMQPPLVMYFLLSVWFKSAWHRATI